MSIFVTFIVPKFFFILLKSLLAIFANDWLLLLISNYHMVGSSMCSAFAKCFKSNIWMTPGLHILLIFTVSHGPSLVGFGVFCSFQVQIDYECAGSY